MADEQAVSSLYAAMGEERLARMVAGFYRRVPSDDVLGPMYPPHDLAAAEQRLLAFFRYRFGGPQNYMAERGHPRLRMRHAPFAVDRAARDRWMQLMEAAIAEAEVPAAPAAVLHEFLGDLATFLINR